jgi:hypothetical protein
MKTDRLARLPLSLKRFVAPCFICLLSLLVIGSAVGAPSNSEAETKDRGYLTSIADLQNIRRMAFWGNQRGVEPYASWAQDFLSDAGTPDSWDYGHTGGALVTSGSSCVASTVSGGERFMSQQQGAQAVYKKMIAYHLTQNIAYAQVARAKILEAITTTSFGGEVYDGSNQCILLLAFSIPLWIQSADLLEGSSVWTAADKTAFQTWLRDQVYRKVAWASRARRNNWGSSGSLAASMIGDYLTGTNMTLAEVKPAALSLTPQQAYAQHNDMQLARMNTTWKGDSHCAIWGIQSYGGIPDELRRGSTGCTGQYLGLTDDSYAYQITEIDHLVFHAEFLRRRGDYRIYNNEAADHSGSLLRAILFVIQNPVQPNKSFHWDNYKTGVLSVAYYYYQNSAIHGQIYTGSLERGAMISYGQLTDPLLIP